MSVSLCRDPSADGWLSQHVFLLILQWWLEQDRHQPFRSNAITTPTECKVRHAQVSSFRCLVLQNFCWGKSLHSTHVTKVQAFMIGWWPEALQTIYHHHHKWNAVWIIKPATYVGRPPESAAVQNEQFCISYRCQSIQNEQFYIWYHCQCLFYPVAAMFCVRPARSPNSTPPSNFSTRNYNHISQTT